MKKTETDMIKEIYIEGGRLPILMVYPYKDKSEKHLLQKAKKRLSAIGEKGKILYIK